MKANAAKYESTLARACTFALRPPYRRSLATTRCKVRVRFKHREADATSILALLCLSADIQKAVETTTS